MADVTVEPRGAVARVLLDRPDQRNALNVSMAEELADAIRGIDAGRYRAILLTGRGSSFSAGADFAEYRADETGKSRYSELVPVLGEICELIYGHELPVIAYVNGPALGAGAILALWCDLRIASSAARLGIPAGKLGVVVDHRTIQRLLLLAGPAVSADLLVAARTLDADACLAEGLVNRVAADLIAEDEADQWAAEIAELAPMSVAAHKAAIRGILDSMGSGSAAFAGAIGEAMEKAFRSRDLQEGIAAFSEKRKPEFSGD